MRSSDEPCAPERCPSALRRDSMKGMQGFAQLLRKQAAFDSECRRDGMASSLEQQVRCRWRRCLQSVDMVWRLSVSP